MECFDKCQYKSALCSWVLASVKMCHLVYDFFRADMRKYIAISICTVFGFVVGGLPCHVSRSTWDHGNTWSPSQTATSLYSHHCLCLMDRSSGGSCFLGYLFQQPGQTLIFPEILHRMNREGGVYWGWGVTKIFRGTTSDGICPQPHSSP